MDEITPSMMQKLAIIDKFTPEQLEYLYELLSEKKSRKDVNREYYLKHKAEIREKAKKTYEAKKSTVSS